MVLIIVMSFLMGVDPYLALSVAKTESGFDYGALGDKGRSFGAFQVKCTTARWMGFRLECDQLLNPVINTFYGLTYLKSKLDKHGFKGGISAYNAGKPLVKKCGKFRNGKYVNKVLTNYNKFTSL